MGGLVQVTLEKKLENSPILVLIFWGSILFVYTLLKVIGHYDLSVLSMSVMRFQTKSWGELYPVFFNLIFLNLAELPIKR